MTLNDKNFLRQKKRQQQKRTMNYLHFEMLKLREFFLVKMSEPNNLPRFFFKIFIDA